MKQQQTSSESGQVLVILLLVIVALLGFAALAIDGGMVFSERRGAQNAADAGVMAGGYRVANTLEDYELGFSINYLNWDCNEVQAVMNIAEPEVGIQTSSNGYALTNDDPMDCANVDKEIYFDRYVDTDAIIVSEVQTSFLHFVFGGQMENTVEAISRVRPRMPLAFGFAIYALGDGCNTGGNPGGVIFDGGGADAQVIVNNGGILSNTCLIGNGGIEVQVNGGDINYHQGSDYECNGSGCSISPAPGDYTEPVPDWALLFPKPDCSGLSPQTSISNGTIHPGIYTDNLTVHNNDELIMEPGLYCFKGANFSATGGEIVGNGVTIYMMIDPDHPNNSSDISITGGTHTLSAPSYVENDEDGIKGMLIYVDEEYAGNISLNGGGASSFTGVIFAENPNSTVAISGNEDCIFNTQIIAGQVTVGGTATVDVTFLDNQVYYIPAQLTLQK